MCGCDHSLRVKMQSVCVRTYFSSTSTFSVQRCTVCTSQASIHTHKHACVPVCFYLTHSVRVHLSRHILFCPFQASHRTRSARPTAPPSPPTPPVSPSSPRSPTPVDESPFEFEPLEPSDLEYEATLPDQYERQLRGVRGRRPIAVVALSATQQLWVVPELGEFPSSFVCVAAVPYHGRLCVACSKCHCFGGATAKADHIFQYASGDNLFLTQLDHSVVHRWLDEHTCPHVTALTTVSSNLLPMYVASMLPKSLTNSEEHVL